MGAYRLLVLNNPASGTDEEHSEWYDKQHIPDVLDVPGFVAAQRFRVSDVQVTPNPRWRYLVVYEIETDDIQKTLHEDLAARRGTDKMIMHPSFVPEQVEVSVFEAASPRITAKDVAAARHRSGGERR